MRFAIPRLVLLCGLAIGLSAPLTAHGDHKKHPHSEQMEAHESSHRMGDQAATAMHPDADEMMDNEDVDRSKMGFAERALNWIGRLHPVIVHFPIAFFPAALVAAVVGRRQPSFAKPVPFLVISGSIVAPIAALLGWMDAGWGFGDDDWLLHFHRWLGTSIGILGLALGVWAARRPDRPCGRTMITALTVITAALIVQGWFGGAMVHGLHHLDW